MSSASAPPLHYTAGPRNSCLFGPNYSRTIAMVSDGLSNTLAVSEGYIGHAQYRSCMTSPAVPSDPSVRHVHPDERPAAGPGVAECSAQPRRLVRHGERQDQSRAVRSDTLAGTTAVCITRASPPPTPPNCPVSRVSRYTGPPTTYTGRIVPID